MRLPAPSALQPSHVPFDAGLRLRLHTLAQLLTLPGVDVERACQPLHAARRLVDRYNPRFSSRAADPAPAGELL